MQSFLFSFRKKERKKAKERKRERKKRRRANEGTFILEALIFHRFDQLSIMEADTFFLKNGF